jgi:hypothetical protein
VTKTSVSAAVAAALLLVTVTACAQNRPIRQLGVKLD